MTYDPQIVTLAALTTGVGYLMVMAGFGKNALERKRRRRVCPSCGHAAPRSRCACTKPS